LRDNIINAEEIDKRTIEELRQHYNRQKLIVEVYREDDKDIYDPLNKAKKSLPFKPGILIE
jgi:hypothetical protein